MSDTQSEVLRIFREMFEDEAVDPDSDFYDLGGDSHLAVTMGLLLEDRFEMEIPVELLEQATTVRALAAWIDDRRGQS